MSGWMFLLVPAHLGSPRQRAVKRSCVCVCVLTHTMNDRLLKIIALWKYSGKSTNDETGKQLAECVTPLQVEAEKFVFVKFAGAKCSVKPVTSC